MLIAFDDGSVVHELEVVVHDPDATVADLVRALDPTHARPLARGRRRRPALRPPARPGRHHHRRDDHPPRRHRPATRRPAGAAPLATLRVAGGLEAGEQAELRVGRVAVGRGAPLAGLRSTTVSARHAELTLDGDGRVTVADGGSRNGTWLDGAPGPGTHSRAPGVGAAPRRGPPRGGDAGARTARPRWPSPAPPDRPRCRSTAHPALRLRPRPIAVEPPTPPVTRAPPHPVGVVSVVAPIAMGLVMVVVFDSLLFGLFALLSPVVLLGTALESRRRGRRGGRRDRQRYDRELAAFRATLAARAEAARDRGSSRRGPTRPRWCAAPTTPSTRLWERRRDHPDTLHLRVGDRTGAVGPAGPRASPRPPPGRGRRGHRRRRPPARRAGAARPLGGGVVGVVGHRAAALAVARSLVLQAATHHGPADLGLAVVASADHADRLGLGEVAAAHARARRLGPRAGSPLTVRAPTGSSGRCSTRDADAPRLVVLDDEG